MNITNTTIGFPRTAPFRWTWRQRVAASLGALALAAALAAAAMQMSRPAEKVTAPAFGPAAVVEVPLQAPAYYLVSSQEAARNVWTWLRLDGFEASSFAHVVIVETEADEAGFYARVRDLQLFDGLSAAIYDLR